MIKRETWIREVVDHGVIGVRVSSRELGVPIRVVAEVTRTSEVTSVPLAPAHVIGLVNLRGQLITVIDVARLLDADSSRVGAPDRELATLVVLKTNDELAADARIRGVRTAVEKFALLVDAVCEVHMVGAEHLSEPAANVTAKEHIFATYHSGGSTLACLEPNSLVQVS